MLKKLSLFITYMISFSFLFSCKNDQLSCPQIADNYYDYKEQARDSTFATNLLNRLNDTRVHDKNCIYSYLLASDIHLHFKDHREAKKDLEKVLMINPQSVYALFNLGIVYMAEKKYDSAIQSFRYAEKLKSQNGMILERTKESYEITGQKIPIDIDYTEIIFNDAVACFYGHYLLDARDRFKYCIGNKEKLAETYFFLGLIYLEIKYYKNVCEYMNLAYEHGNRDAEEYISKYCKSDTVK